MKEKRLALNTITSLVFQLTTIICGFVTPWLLLQYYGSEVNGLVNSITQFLTIISFLELGVGAVIQSSLYSPLANNNIIDISKIIISGGKFFKKIAYILTIYVVFLIFLYPFFSSQSFSWIYTTTLIVAISISYFAQYYFGVVDRLLLTADQRGYIQYTAQILTLIINTLVCALLIKLRVSIQLVKLTTSLIYLSRPIILRCYVNKHYNIDRKIHYVGEPIKQKWNGLAQHVAAIVLEGTDNIVLTVFSTLSNVSIYSVYHLVVYGVKQLFVATTGGIQAFIGELWAKQEIEKLNVFFGWFEWLIHIGTVFIFGCTGMLIVPFVQVYTAGVSDANYIQPFFATLLVLANAMHCLRIPYNVMILAGGHYKQTQNNYFLVAAMNIIISIISVSIWGLIGVAIGTLIAMMYQTIWMAYYDSNNLLRWPFKNFLKLLFVDIISVVLIGLAGCLYSMGGTSYFSWIILACKTGVINLIIVIVVNWVFYRKYIYKIVKSLETKFLNRII